MQVLGCGIERQRVDRDFPMAKADLKITPIPLLSAVGLFPALWTVIVHARSEEAP
jgi:hypothetical protein